MRFEQQVALVTGAASGIGRALVQRFVARERLKRLHKPWISS